MCVKLSSVVCVTLWCVYEGIRLSRCGACAFYKLTFIASAVGGAIASEQGAASVGVHVRSARADGARVAASGHTGDKTDSARQPGPARSASGRTPVPPPRRRWVPPSSLRHHDVPDGDAKHDSIFRKVRGILNKLTPEKFQKLSDDLLGLELDSDKVLKGVILLIFEKALDEPKYSSMYAQLCKRLSEEAPNFEPPGQPCTFKLLLLNKCRTEFENRAQAFAAFEDEVLSPDEEEKRHLAKCKMLGNIKFIGELGKLEILAESILHRCIQNLLARRAAAEHHEDLECLAQLVRTCGRVLDSERGRGLMDQYFARIETLSASRELAPRIRFMLRDVVELRRGGWVPRAAVTAEGPVPIHQLRGDDEPPRRERDRDRDRDRDREPLFRRARPLDDVLAGLSLQPAAALVPPADKLFGNGFAGRDAFRQRSAPGYFPRQPPHYGKQQQAPPKESGGGRAGKSRVYAVGAAALSEVQMRPAANSLMFTANRLSRPQPALQPVQPNVLTPAFASAPPIMKEPAITIKPAPDKKDKPKKDKGVNKEEACRLGVEAVEALAGTCADARQPPDAGALPAAPADEPAAEPCLRRLQDLQLPDKVLRRVISTVLEYALTAGGGGGPGGGGGGGRGAGGRARVGGVPRGARREARGRGGGGARAGGGRGARARAAAAAAGARRARAPGVAGGAGRVVRGRRAPPAAAGRAAGAARAAGRRAAAAAVRGEQAEPERVRGRGGGRRRAGGAGGARAGRAGAAAARAGGAAPAAAGRAGAARAVPLDQGQRGAGRARRRGVRVVAGGAGGGARDGRGWVAGAGRGQGGAGAREGAGGVVRAAADGAAGPPGPAAGRRLRRAGARAPPPLPQGDAAALVHVPVQPGGVRGGRVPALARGRDRRLPRQGRGAVPGEHVADVAAAAGVGGRGGGGLVAAVAAAAAVAVRSPQSAATHPSALGPHRFYFALISYKYN